MPSINLFSPKAAGTVSITTSGASQNVALGATGGGSRQVRVKNIDTTNLVFINFGNSSVTAATATGVPIGPGETAGFTIDNDDTHVAAISSAGTPVVYFTVGYGV